MDARSNAREHAALRPREAEERAAGRRRERSARARPGRLVTLRSPHPDPAWMARTRERPVAIAVPDRPAPRAPLARAHATPSAGRAMTAADRRRSSGRSVKRVGSGAMSSLPACPRARGESWAGRAAERGGGAHRCLIRCAEVVVEASRSEEVAGVRRWRRRHGRGGRGRRRRWRRRAPPVPNGSHAPDRANGSSPKPAAAAAAGAGAGAGRGAGRRRGRPRDFLGAFGAARGAGPSGGGARRQRGAASPLLPGTLIAMLPCSEKSCGGAAGAAAIASASRSFLSHFTWSCSVTLNSKASLRSTKPIPRKACLPLPSSTRSTK